MSPTGRCCIWPTNAVVSAAGRSPLGSNTCREEVGPIHRRLSAAPVAPCPTRRCKWIDDQLRFILLYKVATHSHGRLLHRLAPARELTADPLVQPVFLAGRPVVAGGARADLRRLGSTATKPTRTSGDNTVTRCCASSNKRRPARPGPVCHRHGLPPAVGGAENPRTMKRPTVRSRHPSGRQHRRVDRPAAGGASTDAVRSQPAPVTDTAKPAERPGSDQAASSVSRQPKRIAAGSTSFWRSMSSWCAMP